MTDTLDLCSRCGGPGRLLVPAYWNDNERYCSPCCVVIAAEHDVGGTWPPLPAGWFDNDNPDGVNNPTRR